jgi:chromosome segregation ATPase
MSHRRKLERQQKVWRAAKTGAQQMLEAQERITQLEARVAQQAVDLEMRNHTIAEFQVERDRFLKAIADLEVTLTEKRSDLQAAGEYITDLGEEHHRTGLQLKEAQAEVKRLGRRVADLEKEGVDKLRRRLKEAKNELAVAHTELARVRAQLKSEEQQAHDAQVGGKLATRLINRGRR